MLAIPVKNTIQFYESEKWTRKKTYENDSMDEVRPSFLQVSSHSRFDLGDQFDQLFTMSNSIRHLLCQWSNLDYQSTDV